MVEVMYFLLNAYQCMMSDEPGILTQETPGIFCQNPYRNQFWFEIKGKDSYMNYKSAR